MIFKLRKDPESKAMRARGDEFAATYQKPLRMDRTIPHGCKKKSAFRDTKAHSPNEMRIISEIRKQRHQAELQAYEQSGSKLPFKKWLRQELSKAA